MAANTIHYENEVYLTSNFYVCFTTYITSLVAQTVKHLPAMRETLVRFLGQEDSLEKEMAIHSSTLAWKIPWMEEPGRLQSMWSWRVGHDWASNPQLIWLDVKRWHALCIYCKACKHAGDTQTKAHLLPILTHTHSATHTHTLLCFPPVPIPILHMLGQIY